MAEVVGCIILDIMAVMWYLGYLGPDIEKPQSQK